MTFSTGSSALRIGAVAVSLLTTLAAACTQSAPEVAAPPVAAEPAPPAAPQAVDGWIEYPATDAIARVQAARWRSDTINIPLAAGTELEYKLNVKKGDALAYAISYGSLQDPSAVVSEFHGHTEQRADGVGDLMYYSKTSGVAQSGQLVAPWDGVHGWYLKNTSMKNITVKLQLAGFYELIPDQL